jgi:hypothetical protein
MEWNREGPLTRRITNDIVLGDGFGHWVLEGPYQKYIKKFGNDVEVSLTSGSFEADANLLGSDLAKPLQLQTSRC